MAFVKNQFSVIMNNLFFNNKVVVVTGGTDGIGKALIESLISKNVKIATCGRNQSKLDDLKKQYHSLAKKYHPDKGGTKEQFQELQNNYDGGDNSRCATTALWNNRKCDT